MINNKTFYVVRIIASIYPVILVKLISGPCKITMDTEAWYLPWSRHYPFDKFINIWLILIGKRPVVSIRSQLKPKVHTFVCLSHPNNAFWTRLHTLNWCNLSEFKNHQNIWPSLFIKI